MTSNSKTFCSLYDSYEDRSAHLFRGYGFREVRHCEDADIIVFNGGADIGTSIYNEQPIYRGIPLNPSRRDQNEINLFNKYKNSKKLFVGICRGAQLLNCLNGGTLWQDVNNHTRSHMMLDVESGERIMVTSTHHQMMRPHYTSAHIIGVADEATRKAADLQLAFEAYPDAHKDTEIVYYAKSHSLCIQGHPEYVPNSKFADYCLDLIHKYLHEVQNA